MMRTQVNDKIGYLTRIPDIIKMVKSDFGVNISEETAANILEANNHSRLTWNDTLLEASPEFNIPTLRK